MSTGTGLLNATEQDQGLSWREKVGLDRPFTFVKTWVKGLRHGAGLSQLQAAEVADVAYNTLYCWEQERSLPEFTHAVDLIALEFRLLADGEPMDMDVTLIGRLLKAQLTPEQAQYVLGRYAAMVQPVDTGGEAGVDERTLG